MNDNRNNFKMDSANTPQSNQSKYKRGNKNASTGQQIAIPLVLTKKPIDKNLPISSNLHWTSVAINSTPNGVPIKNKHTIPSDILDDLSSRFIINVPDDERSNLIRICFQVELAHWFYLDFFCSIVERKLVPCGFKQFAVHIFHHIPFLQKHLLTLDKTLDDWKTYKSSVPTYGAILITKDLHHALLVQSFLGKCWGFPKGKINENEDPVHCAIREVYEETGYDLTGSILPNEYIECVINYQFVRLYIVRDVPHDTKFVPRTRNEIKSCEWFPVDSLPTNRNDVISKQNLGINANLFFMIMPFIKRLKKWIQDNRSGVVTKRELPSPIMTYNNYTGGPYNRQSSKSEGDTSNNPKFYKKNAGTNQSFNSKDGKVRASKTDKTTTAAATTVTTSTPVAKGPPTTSTPVAKGPPTTSTPVAKGPPTTTTPVAKGPPTTTTPVAKGPPTTTTPVAKGPPTTTTPVVTPKVHTKVSAKVQAIPQTTVQANVTSKISAAVPAKPPGSISVAFQPTTNNTAKIKQKALEIVDAKQKNGNNNISDQPAPKTPFKYKKIKKLTSTFDAWINFKFDVDEIVKVF